MVFGDVADFAIQAEVEPDLAAPSPVWGRMCVWCRGTALGDIRNTHVALYPAACAFEWAMTHLGELWDESLAGLSDPNVFALLDTAYFGNDDRTAERVHADATRYGKFNFLTNWEENFDGFKAFLICPPSKSVRIVYRLPDDTLGSGEVTKTGFLVAAEEFVHWFGEQAVRLRGEYA